MAIEKSRELGAYHIANNSVEYNPQRRNNFTLIVHGLTNIARMGSVDSSIGALTDEDVIADGQEQLVLGLASCDIPQISQNTITINRGNSQIKFPGKPTFNELSLTVNDYIGSDIKDTLYAWQNQSYNPKYDSVGMASDYKHSCELLQLTPEGDLVRYWEIKGAWISRVNPDGFDMGSDGNATVSATLVYDWAMIHTPDDYEPY